MPWHWMIEVRWAKGDVFFPRQTGNTRTVKCRSKAGVPTKKGGVRWHQDEGGDGSRGRLSTGAGASGILSPHHQKKTKQAKVQHSIRFGRSLLMHHNQGRSFWACVPPMSPACTSAYLRNPSLSPGFRLSLELEAIGIEPPRGLGA